MSGSHELSAPSRLLLDTGTLRVGRFHVSPRHPDFAHAGQVFRHEFVFPRTSVWIEHPGQRPFVADPTTVTFYNREEPYARRALSPEGDRCDWFAVEPALLDDLVRGLDPWIDDRPHRPFRFTHGPVDAASYARQRLVFHHVATQACPDPLFVEEEMIGVLRGLLCRAYDQRRARTAAARPPARAAELVDRIRAHALAHPGEKLTLARFAAVAGCTPFHLCRAVRSTTGGTLHAWLVRLRLHVALERVAEPGSDLTEIALDLGFSSHSHFTEAFRRAFGMTPSAFRRRARTAEVSRLSASEPGYSGSSSRAGSGRKKLATRPIA
jgi:AraC family transcriptional regulator